MNLGALEAYAEMKDQFSETINKFVEGVERMESTFERMTGGVEKGTTAVVGALVAGTAAVVGMTAAVVELAMHGDEVNDVSDSFEQLAGGAENAEAVMQKLRAGTLGTVSDMELMKETNTALGVGLKLTSDQFEQLAQGAVLLSKRGMGSVQQGYQSMIQAMVTGRTRSLEMAGAQINVERSTLNYALSVGKSTEELSKQEQQAARTSAVLASVGQMLDKQGAPQASFADNIIRIKTNWDNFLDSFARAVSVSPVVNKALDLVDQQLSKTFGKDRQGQIDVLMTKVNAFVIALTRIGEGATYVAEVFYDGFKSIELVVAGVLTGIVGGLDLLMKGVTKSIDFINTLPGASKLQLSYDKSSMNELDAFTDDLAKQTAGIVNDMEEQHVAFEKNRAELKSWRTSLEAVNKPIAGPKPSGGEGGVKVGGAVTPDTGGKNYLGELQASLNAAKNKIHAELGAPGVAGLTAREFSEAFGGALDGIDKQAKILGKKLPDDLAGALKKSQAFKVSEMLKDDLPQAMSQYEQYSEQLRQMDLTGEAARLDAIETEKQAALSSLAIQVSKRTEAYKLANDGAMPPPELLTIWGMTADQINAVFERKKVGTTLAKSIEGAMAGLPQTIMGAIQGGGNVLQSAGSSIFGAMFGAGTKLTAGLTKKLGSTFGSMIPGAGAIIGGLAGALGDKLIGGIFGPSQKDQVKKALDDFAKGEGGMSLFKQKAQDAGVSLDKLFATDNMKDYQDELDKVNEKLELMQGLQAFEKEEGGLNALKRKAEEAGISLDKMFDAKNAKELDYEIGKIKEQLDLNHESQDKLNAAMDKYGITIEQLGPKFQQQHLVDEGMKVFEEFKLLQGAGVDVGTIISKMTQGTKDGASDLTKFIQDAMKTGQAIPLAMKPMIEAMAVSGKLTDGQGHAFKNAEEAGIKFSETMDEKFGDLLDSIQRLVDALNGIPSKPIDVSVSTTYSSGTTPPGNYGVPGNYPGPANGGAPSFVGGSHGVVNFGHETWARLHGREAVVTETDFDKLTSSTPGAGFMQAQPIQASVTGGAVSIQIVQQPGQDGAALARQLSLELSRKATADAAALHTEIQKIADLAVKRAK